MTDARERRAAAQDADYEAKAAAFESLCPNIIGNPYVPHFPLPAQAIFLGAHQFAPPTERAFEALYGGAAGGGKSDALLMAAAQTAWGNPGSASVLIRLEFTMMMKADSLLRRAQEWWLNVPGVHYSAKTNTFKFPGGSLIEFAHHGHAKDNKKFQGAAYQFVGWDELTHWPNDIAYRWLLSRMRRGEDRKAIPLRMLSASNPGSDGHAWVKERFVGGVGIDGVEVEAPEVYIPARIEDNPYLDRAAYIATLEMLHPTVRDQLLKGNWDARDPGDYFRADWFGPLLDPVDDAWPDDQKVSVRWWDLAASEKADACHTAGVLMSRHVMGVRAVEHCTSFKKTPGSRDDAIVRQAKIDGRRVVVGIEIEPGSGGIAQFDAIAKRLRLAGYRVAGARPKVITVAETDLVIRAPSSDNAKAARADPVASCLERGYQRRGESPDMDGEWWGLDLGRAADMGRDGLRLFVGPWTQAYLDVVEGFPGEGRADEADATTGAWAWLEAHPWGSRTAPRRTDAKPPAQLQDIHPADRPDPADHKGRHYTP